MTRFVAGGNHVPEYEETFGLFAAVLDAISLRAMFAFGSANLKWRWRVTDICQAFAKEVAWRTCGLPVALQPPSISYELGLAEEGHMWLVEQAIYRLRESPAMWSQYRDSQLALARWTVEVNESPITMKLEQMITDNQVLRIAREDGQGDPYGYLPVCMEDLLVSGADAAMWGFFEGFPQNGRLTSSMCLASYQVPGH